MGKIEKIRQEIERHRQAIRVLNEHTAPEQTSKTCAIFQYSDTILSDLLSFIDTLPEEPDKSLEEAAEEYFYRNWSDGSLDIKPQVKEDFKAGAEWQKKRFEAEYELDWLTDLKKDLYELGRKDEREQMLKEAVEGTYNNSDWGIPCIDLPSPLELERFDKVRIIIVKEEESK